LAANGEQDFDLGEFAKKRVSGPKDLFSMQTRLKLDPTLDDTLHFFSIGLDRVVGNS